MLIPPPKAAVLERGCVQHTSRSMLVEYAATSGGFQQSSRAKLLRLVFDTAARRGQRHDAPL